jgi:hypothetical protein
VFLVTCDNPACNGRGFTEDSGPGDFDDAVRCTTAAGVPAGTPAGLCCTTHRTHEAHVEHVRKTGNSSCRPVTITIIPGSTRLKVAG